MHKYKQKETIANKLLKNIIKLEEEMMNKTKLNYAVLLWGFFLAILGFGNINMPTDSVFL